MTGIETTFVSMIFALTTFVQVFIAMRMVKIKGSRLIFIVISIALVPTLLLVNFNMDDYDVSGWKAIGRFDFSVESFLLAGLTYTGITYALMFGYWFVSKVVPLPRYLRRNLPGSALKWKKNIRRSGDAYNLVMIIVLMAFGWLMYGFDIGITGAAPQQLPYKLTGFIYYGARLVLPVMILIMYEKKRISVPGVLAIMLPITFIGLVTMSKFQIAVLISPILYSLFRDRRWRLFATIFACLLIIITTAPNTRNVFFSIEDGEAVLSRRDFGFMVETLFLALTSGQTFELTIGLLDRIVSMRNTILAMQVQELGGVSILNFVPIINEVFGGQGREATFITHGFMPPLGFATGLDFVSLFIVLAYHEPLLFISAIILLSFLFRFNEIAVAKSEFVPREHFTLAVVFLSFVMCFLPSSWYLICVVGLLAAMLYKRLVLKKLYVIKRQSISYNKRQRHA